MDVCITVTVAGLAAVNRREDTFAEERRVFGREGNSRHAARIARIRNKRVMHQLLPGCCVLHTRMHRRWAYDESDSSSA
jgi:hypothetical protein